MTPQADRAIKAFHQVRQTGDASHVAYLTYAELSAVMDELARFSSDWFYPMMQRRLERLKETPPKTLKEKLKGFFH